MKVLLLNPPFGHDRPEGLDAPLGLMCLGRVLRDTGHSCSLVDHVWQTAGDWSAWQTALATTPDVVLLNTQRRFQDESLHAIALARHAAPQAAVIAFGPQASTEPDVLLDGGCHACLCGEPEHTAPAVLQEWNQRHAITPAAGIATSMHSAVPLAPRLPGETLPEPDYELADYGRYIATTHNAVFMASRGADTADAFYQPPLIYATQPAARLPVPRVIDQLTRLRRRFAGAYMLLFHDEVFTEDRDWVLALCQALPAARLRLPYWCFTRPDCLDDELARVLKRTGFAGVSMGLESGSDRVLDMLQRGLTVADLRRGFGAARQAGLITVGSVMIGTPGETADDLAATADLVAELHPDVLTLTRTTPLAGTALFEQYAERLLAQSQDDFNYYHNWPGKYPLQLDALTADDLDRAEAAIRSRWKRGLWKTLLRLQYAALTNAPLRRTLTAQVAKVLRRKVLGRHA